MSHIPHPESGPPRPGRAFRARRALSTFFQTVGAFFTLGLLAIFFVTMVGSALAGTGVREPIVLELDLREPPPEQRATGAVAGLLGEDGLALRDVIELLDAAGEDEQVVGLVARLGGRSGGLARAQELRDAVARFRESGKLALAYSESFGEYSPGNGGYYIATAFPLIYLQPSGGVGLNGLSYESRFLRGALDKLGIEAQVEGRKEFKSARNQLTERAFTSAHREALQTVLDAQFAQLVTGIAEGRGLDAAGLRTVIDRGPFTASEALAAGLVDGLRYRDELREEVSSRLEAQVSERPRAQDEPLWMRAEDWYDALPSERVPNSNGPVIAWIQGNGAIAAGGGGIDPLSGERTLGADSLGAALRAAARDDEVEAILLRVESPGGSYVASDAIWRETIRAREAGKPLVVSMGNVAGSGGYYIAMDADWIVARPGSITGSIGVLAGKIVTRELFEEKLGITFDRLQSSKNGSMFSQQRAYTEEEEARNASWLDQAYADFTQKVAEGRDLPPAQVQAIARGRIWSGEDALRLGLVDELGGLPEALAKARELAGIEADAPVELRSYPRERGLIATLLGDDSSDVEAMSGPASGGRTGRASLIKAARTSFASPASDPSVSALLETLRPIHEIGRELGLLGESTGALWTPDWPVVP